MRDRIQDYAISPVFKFDEKSSHYDIWERREVATWGVIECPLEYRFVVQGDFTVCCINWENEGFSMGVTRRCAGNKGLMKAAEKVVEYYCMSGVIGNLVSRAQKAAKADTFDRSIGNRIAFARAVDNKLGGYCLA